MNYKRSANSGAMLSLLLEVGCEEIPARFLDEAQQNLRERLRQALEAARLLPEPRAGSPAGTAITEPAIDSFSTPRRLTVYAPQVLNRQADQVEEVLGPPVRVAFDAEGKPTRAAESFAAKNQARLEDLIRVTNPKGEYLAVRRTTTGRPAVEVLAEALPAVITGISFPKSMYWTAKSGPRFIRPVRWLLALLGEGKQAQVVPFEIAGVNSGNSTYGHRTLGKKPVKVQGFGDYAKKLRARLVEFDPARRRETVRQEVKVLLEESGLRAVHDDALEDWIVKSTEWPRALAGSFEERFLKLPREILVTVMRDHQKYFAVEDQSGNLQPRFIAALNVDGDPKGLIRAGHERVLTARFADAEFFWQADQKVPLRDRLPMLEKVTYQEKLGSYADKVRRMETIAREICRTLEEQGKLTPAEAEDALRAVRLSKCDLTTQMVQEFPELQGVVGGLYAAAQGEAPEIAEAIYDHYLPRSADDRCPRSVTGAVVSLADKFDSVVAGFSAGLAPTSSSDPFGLRRAGNGVVRITMELGLPISLRDLAVKYHEAIGAQGGGILTEVPWASTIPDASEFFDDRLRYYLENVRQVRYDTVRAIPKSRWMLTPLDILKCAEALEKARDGEDLQAMAAAARRIRNILTKSATSADWSRGDVDEGALLDEAEKELFRAYQKAMDGVVFSLASEGYEGPLKLLAAMRPQVDRFFDKVLVMAEDPTVRQNRLRLLGKLDALFTSVADLSQIESKTLASVGASTS